MPTKKEKIDKDKIVEEWFKEKIEEKFSNCGSKKTKKHNPTCGGGGLCGFYFLTFLGSAIYWIQNSEGFWLGVVAFLKAIVWPVFVIYEVLGRLGL